MKKAKDGIACPRCGSGKVQSRGEQNGRKKYQCQSCRKWFTDSIETKTTESVTEQGNTKQFSTVVPERILNEQQLISQCEIDTDLWEIERWTCDKKEVIVRGETQTTFQVKCWLHRSQKADAKEAIESLIRDAKAFAPKYPKIQYPKHKEGLLYEIDMADLHFGKLAWNEETGSDYDIQIAEDTAKNAFSELLLFVRHLPLSKILLPLGNDFFNVNGAGEFTVNGTRQVEDTRWQKTFRKGRELLVELIDMCSQIAPVDILVVPGNHDRERMFYAGDALECWYHSNPSIFVDNRAKLRKYYTFGNNLIGFTHGSEEKFTMLPSIMAHEEPEAWGKTKHREWHLGDRHHKEMLVQRVKEEQGVTIRLMRSLTPPDEWHYRTGWIGAEQAAESYLWHAEKGVIGQFTSVRI